jgi:hypothetical protein
VTAHDVQAAGTHPLPTHSAGSRSTVGPGNAIGSTAGPGNAIGPSVDRSAGTSSGGWLSRRRDARAQRRAEAGRQRVVHRVELLGPQWRIVDYNPDDPDFLAVGPGGIFQVTVADHGRSKVQLAGDVVQIEGRRPPYVALAKRDAARISHQMSQLAGRRIPVVPMVAFLGSGEIVYYGKPPEGCVVTSYRDMGRALDAHGNRVGTSTIEKLVALASRVDSTSVGQYLGVPT